ncbi:MAG: class I SAM-dependent methyltransferase [Caldilinea sp. CFX5]|nr:class I SAM-dependent methyltransferase [Caldilinea sp. CFX5]
MSTLLAQAAYDQIATQYAQSQQRSADDGFSWNHDLVIPKLLQGAGAVTGRVVLDAGCGEGVVARYLAEQGATVVGIDISARLIELAQAQKTALSIHYAVHDLSQPLPRYADHFDLVVSNLVLTDVADYAGFAATLTAVTKAGGRIMLSLTNPYSAVMRQKVASYFDSGTATPYPWGAGQVFFYHRTMQEYMAAFRDAGCYLQSLTDVQMTADMVAQLPASNQEMPWFAMYDRFPFFVILEFVRMR